MNVVGIPILFVIVSALVLWLVILGKGLWWVKLLLVSGVLYFSLALWMSITNISGWAADDKLPNKFIIHWGLIKEPDKAKSYDKGTIFIWLTAVDENYSPVKSKVSNWIQPFTSRKQDSEPRTYRVPYSQELHEQMAGAIAAIKKGKTVVGDGEAIGEMGDGEDGNGKGKGKKKGEKGSGTENTPGDGLPSLSNDRRNNPLFYELPPPKLPEKSDPGTSE